MTAAAKTTTATAAAMRPHGFCWVTTLTGGRVRPLPTCPPRCPEALPDPDPPRDVPLFGRPLSGLGSLATAAPHCSADAARAADRAGPPGRRIECRCGTCVRRASEQALARWWGGRGRWGG